MLISVQDIKDFLGIVPTTDDDKIMPLCQAAQDFADGYVDYELEGGGSATIEFLDGEGIDIIQLRNIPIKSITSIYDDIDRLYGSDALISSDDYTFNAKTGIVTLIGLTFGVGVNNIKVTYLAGYGAGYTALPYDLKQAFIYLASAMYLEGKAGVNVFENMEIVYRPSYFKKEALKILDGYRRLSL